MKSRSYRPQPGLIVSPFDTLPSGRNWSTDELQWLHVDFTTDVSLFEEENGSEPGILEVGCRLAPNCAIAEFLRESFGRPWSDIKQDVDCEEEHYLALQILRKGQPKRLSTIVASSPPGTSASQEPLISQGSSASQGSLVSHGPSASQGLPASQESPALQASLSSESQALSTPEHQSSTYKSPRAIYTPSPPAIHTASPPAIHTSSPPAIYTSSPPAIPLTLTRPVTPIGAKSTPVRGTPSTRHNLSQTPESSSRQPVRLLSPAATAVTSSDSTYEDGTSSNLPNLPLEATKPDLPEDTVLFAVTSCFLVLRKAFRKVTNILQTVVEVTSGPKMIIAVEALMCTTTPDLELCIIPNGDNDRAARLFVECKRLIHNMAFDNTLGQEVAHLLAQAEHHFDPSRTRRGKGPMLSHPITTFLVSWHHLTGYITRLDVPAGYMDVFHDDLKLRHEPLVVRRSKPMDLTDPQMRVEFIAVAVTICLRRLARYSRYAEYVAQIRQP